MRKRPKSPTPPTPPPPPPPLPTPALADADATLAADALAEVTLKPSPTPRRNMAFGGTRFEHGGSFMSTTSVAAMLDRQLMPHATRRSLVLPRRGVRRRRPHQRCPSTLKPQPLPLCSPTSTFLLLLGHQGGALHLRVEKDRFCPSCPDTGVHRMTWPMSAIMVPSYLMPPVMPPYLMPPVRPAVRM